MAKPSSPADHDSNTFEMHCKNLGKNREIPNFLGYVMNILNDMEVENFSFGSFVVNAPHLGSYEVQLNVAQQSIPKVGIWHLYVGSSNVTDTYNVTVSVQTTLMATVTFPQNKKTGR